MMIHHVYIAGPLSVGDTMRNIRTAITMGDVLLDLGFMPYVPHLTGFWDVISPKPYEDWMALDMAWLRRCDALLRLPGDSPGADSEVGFAFEQGIPVFYELSELIEGANR